MIDPDAQADPSRAASEYYSGCGAYPRFLAKWRPRLRPFDPLLKWVEPGSSVIDLGCGAGLWLLTLATAGRISEGTGCDIRARALDTAACAFAEYTRRGGKACLQFVRTESWADWPREDFDVVTLVDVLHHVRPEDQEEYLRRALSLVKKGGRLIYKDMAPTPWWAAWGNRLHDLVVARQWIRYFPLQKVRDASLDVGGFVRHEESWRVGFYIHELLVIDR